MPVRVPNRDTHELQLSARLLPARKRPCPCIAMHGSTADVRVGDPVRARGVPRWHVLPDPKDDQVYRGIPLV